METNPIDRDNKVFTRVVLWGSVVLFSIVLGVFLATRSDRSEFNGSRIRADLRSLETVIESYYLDHGAYPVEVPASNFSDRFEADSEVLRKLLHQHTVLPNSISTPVAYTTSHWTDPMVSVRGMPHGYIALEHGWVVYSAGPDGDYDINKAEMERVGFPGLYPHPGYRAILPFTYDPTNGTKSDGDIWRMAQ